MPFFSRSLVIATGLCISFIALVRLPNLKVSALLLLGLVIYDVFWVYFSQYIFSTNVMVRVATREAENPVGHRTRNFHESSLDDVLVNNDREKIQLQSLPRTETLAPGQNRLSQVARRLVLPTVETNRCCLEYSACSRKAVSPCSVWAISSCPGLFCVSSFASNRANEQAAPTRMTRCCSSIA